VKTKLELDLLRTIRRTGLIVPGDRMAVGVSGGSDSVALFRLLQNLRDSLGITLLVVHFDHCLRGAESAADAEFVEALARDDQVEFICERADVAASAKNHSLNLEDAARRLRYAFFERVATDGRASRVAVAHTADDQAETVLARLFRGTGPAGLAGVYPVVRAVVRPLLAHRRAELREYLRRLGQPWREDSTNNDLGRQRAQIRTQLLPVLERDFSPAIVQHLGQLARLSREENEFWEELVENRFFALSHKTRGARSIQINDLLAPLTISSNAGVAPFPPAALRALTERLIRRLYKAVRGDARNLTALHVEQILHLATDGLSGQRAELPGSIQVQRNFGELIFTAGLNHAALLDLKETHSPTSAYHYNVNIPSRGAASVSVPELGTRLLLKVIDWPCPARETRRDDALDADLLPSTLTLRNWQPGDAYRPRGHRQPRKLKEMFLSRRVSRSERVSWPVLESRGQIIWARGMPPADEFCAQESTRLGLVIEEAAL
jgi:tRNA(Ile)-lysidine synthase